MQSILLTSLAVILGLQGVSAHLRLADPLPIGIPLEVSRTSGGNNWNSNLKSDYSNFPCLGFHHQFPLQEGDIENLKTWNAGENATFQILVEEPGVSAPHDGGSCQASISLDRGVTWEVMQSYVGDCPRNIRSSTDFDRTPNQIFGFNVPSDLPNGPAIFAWTWFPVIALREFYMSCAYVNIKNANPNPKPLPPRPRTFVGFMAPGVCIVPEGQNLIFPSPGPNVVTVTPSVRTQFMLPTGAACGDPASGGGETILNNMGAAVFPNIPGFPNNGPGKPGQDTPIGTPTAPPTAVAPTTAPTGSPREGVYTMTVVATLTTMVTMVNTKYVVINPTASTPPTVIRRDLDSPASIARRGSKRKLRAVHRVHQVGRRI